MSARRWLLAAAVLPVAGLVVWLALWPDDWRAWAGFSSQATQQYAFVSGVGPMLLTAVLGSSALATVWHSLNCHQEGCWRIGRHKVKGSPWCNTHHEQARRGGDASVSDKCWTRSSAC